MLSLVSLCHFAGPFAPRYFLDPSLSLYGSIWVKIRTKKVGFRAENLRRKSGEADI